MPSTSTLWVSPYATGISGRPLWPSDVLATVYRVLGIDPTLEFPDHAGRPVPVLADGQAIREVV